MNVTYKEPEYRNVTATQDSVSPCSSPKESKNGNCKPLMYETQQNFPYLNLLQFISKEISSNSE